MKLLSSVRYRHHNWIGPQPVMGLTCALEAGERPQVAPASVAAIEAQLPELGRLRIQVAGDTRPLTQVLVESDLGLWLLVGALGQLLQRELQQPVNAYGMRRQHGGQGVAYFEYEEWVMGETAADAAFQVAQVASVGGDLAKALTAARRRLAPLLLDQTSLALMTEATRRGIPWTRLGRADSVCRLGWGRRQVMQRESLLQSSSSTGFLLAKNKALTSARLRSLGLPSPAFELANSAEGAVAAAARLGGPVVLKPLQLSKAIGVTANLVEPADIRAAYAVAARHGRTVLVERFIPGEDHRLLVVGDRLVAAAQRIPGGVTGDGRSSVGQLLEVANRDPRRGRGFEKLMNLIDYDDEARTLLAAQGLTLESVVPAGQRVRLRRVGNISQGGEAIDVTDRVHPANAAMAVRATKALGLVLAGVDFITPDIAKPWHRGIGGICEVNGSPGLRPHWLGDPARDVVGPIVDLSFPLGDRGRIPLLAVTGTHGKTTTCRMAAAILAAGGATVGLATTDGVQVAGEWVAFGDHAGCNGADLVLGDPSVEAAVLETARGGMIRRGIAFDACDVAAVTGIGDDHIGVMGVASLDEMAALKGRLVVTAARAAVLNGADPRCVALRARLRPGARLCWVLPEGAAPAPEAAGAESEIVTVAPHAGSPWIVHQSAGAVTPLLALDELPATLGGRLPFNVTNALFAAAMTLALGLPPETVRAGLAGFRLGQRQSLGRFQFLERGGRTVLLDYAHNPEQVAQACRLLTAGWPGRRRIGALTAPGRRRAGFNAEVAAAAAGHFDHYVCYERVEWRRDNPPGRISGELVAGLQAAGVAAERITHALTQPEALERAFALAQPGDLLAILAGEPHRVAAAVRRRWPASDGGAAAD